MPSTFKHPAHVPMWKGVKVAYFFIAMCLFPVAIGGFWAYGNLVSCEEAFFNNSIRSSSHSSSVIVEHAFPIELDTIFADAFRRNSKCLVWLPQP